MAVSPPSTDSVAPWMFAALSLTRNATAAATCSGVLGRCDGARAMMRWIRSAYSAMIGVMVGPGATVFTRTPNGPYSAAQDFVNEWIAAFVASQ
jgi:hypothetical protein